jgi:hypothetical protein
MADADSAPEGALELLYHPEMHGFPLISHVERSLTVLPGMVDVAEMLSRDSLRRAAAERPLLNDGERGNLERMLMGQLRALLDDAHEAGDWAHKYGANRAREWLAARQPARAD